MWGWAEKYVDNHKAKRQQEQEGGGWGWDTFHAIQDGLDLWDGEYGKVALRRQERDYEELRKKQEEMKRQHEAELKELREHVGRSQVGKGFTGGALRPLTKEDWKRAPPGEMNPNITERENLYYRFVNHLDENDHLYHDADFMADYARAEALWEEDEKERGAALRAAIKNRIFQALTYGLSTYTAYQLGKYMGKKP